MRISIFLIFSFLAQWSHASWVLSQKVDGDQVIPQGVRAANVSDSVRAQFSWLGAKTLRNIRYYLPEGAMPSKEFYREVLWLSNELPEGYRPFLQSPRLSTFGLATTEVRKLVDQGPDANRIVLTFLGDGYTQNEKEKFFSDVNLMLEDLFGGATFQSYRPLFNAYAIFTPSKDSGITDVQRKSTAFGLYRSPAGSKRGIMPGNSSVIDRTLRLVGKTDYPIIIANDDFYGGLGGKYAITTSSRESGKIVLRHELGHNFGEVGEEYDNGQVYSGANSTTSKVAPWSQWYTPDSPKEVQQMKLLSGNYIWSNLANNPFKTEFNFPAPVNGRSWKFDIKVSTVGWETAQDVEVLLDGKVLPLTGKFTSDRSFFGVTPFEITPGKHTLEARETKSDGNNVLAFATTFAYHPDYKTDGTIGLYETYDTNGRVSYRPTHEQCLMRDMTTDHFCSVDQENMWVQFFKRVQLIDSVDTSGSDVVINALQLPGLSVTWFAKMGSSLQEIPALTNQLKASKALLGSGSFRVQLNFQTPEVRKAVSNFSAVRDFNL